MCGPYGVTGADIDAFPALDIVAPGGVGCSPTAMSSLGHDFDSIRREADARRLGAALYREAARLSSEAVEDVAAVLAAVAARSGDQAVAVADEYAKEMMAGAAEGAYERTAGM